MAMNHQDCDPTKVRDVVHGMNLDGVDEYSAINAVKERAFEMSITLNEAEEAEAAGQLLEKLNG